MGENNNQNENKKSAFILNENTLVPMSFLILIIIGVMRTESTAFTANANEKEIKNIKEEFKELTKELKKHGQSLARIEGALGTKQQEVAKDSQ